MSKQNEINTINNLKNALNSLTNEDSRSHAKAETIEYLIFRLTELFAQSWDDLGEDGTEKAKDLLNDILVNDLVKL